MPLLLGQRPFQHFLQLSDAIHERQGESWKISLRRLFRLVHDAAAVLPLDPAARQAALLADYEHSPLKGPPPFIGTEPGPTPGRLRSNRRQARHA